MEEKRIKIDEKISIYIEKLYYEYNSYLDILRYLVDNCKNKEFFDTYFAEAREKYAELEIAKNQASTANAPTDFTYNEYIFDFSNSEIVYVNR